MTRPLAVSLVAFDGIPAAAALAAVAASGASHVEPAYINGTMVFTENDLSEVAAGGLRAAVAQAGLHCLAISAHMDCGADNAAAGLERRLRFAAALGARFVITNTARQDRREAFLRNAALALRIAERYDVVIAFENPGHGDTDLLRSAASAAELLRDIGSPWATLNYDVGNALTNSEGEIRPERDLDAALQLAGHLHLKDMVSRNDTWVYTEIGGGDLDYRAILGQIARSPDLPICVEIPLRQVRRRDAPPTRGDGPPLATVQDIVARSVRFVQAGLGDGCD